MRRVTLGFTILCLLLCALLVLPLSAQQKADEGQVVGEFLLLLLGSEEGKREALAYLQNHWQPELTPMLLEVITFNRDPAFGVQLVQLLESKTGRSFGFNMNQWLQWQWNQPPQFHPLYPEFKSALYGLLDEHFEGYFGLGRAATIRLDEVMWGGVAQDGIPPLRSPAMLAAGDASYLADTDIVFGLEINGDARAYPRRILGWHEMFVDEVGGEPVAGVYCTLCGTMILYRTTHRGVVHELGTSGFLYRSNKLMYDRATQSLWNTLWGKPVVGPLVDQNIELQRLAVVTTTWGEWRRRHPGSVVLSADTGYDRDYAEGAAYRDYFATDELMFPVPGLDSRLRNKDEVLGLVFAAYPGLPLAIAVDFLASHRLYQDQLGQQRFVVLTDDSGASRVYEAGTRQFAAWDGEQRLRDAHDQQWLMSEAGLTGPGGEILHRLPAQRAFWFGWYSAYTHTRLVH